MKRRDPIIEELHRVREGIGKSHDFDVRRIADAIRQHEDEHPQGVVRQSPKRTPRQKKASSEARTSNQCGRTAIEGAISRATAGGISTD